MKEKTGLYIHIPFCVCKCSYCDFYSLGYSEALATAYTKRILSEIHRWGGALGCPPADTLYFGGGTPSLLKSEQIKAIIDECKEVFSLKDAEITLEVNPGDKLDEYFCHVANFGVNRISLGLQSAVDSELKALSRRHTAKDVATTVTAAKKTGIDNISLDIMLGIPGQTKESLKSTVDFALKQEPAHISAYLLTLEPGTPLYKNQKDYIIPNSDEAGELYLYACELLKAGGYDRYEISNFAKEGKISRHNRKYWVGTDYLGLGPSAHSFIGGKRFFYGRDINAYLKNPQEIKDGDGGGIDERIMLGLRLAEGVSIKALVSQFNELLDQNKINRLIKKAELFHKNGLAIFNGDVISLTDRGALVSNAVIAEFIECIET